MIISFTTEVPIIEKLVHSLYKSMNWFLYDRDLRLKNAAVYPGPLQTSEVDSLQNSPSQMFVDVLATLLRCIWNTLINS